MLFPSGGDAQTIIADNCNETIGYRRETVVAARCPLELFWLFGGTNPLFEPSMPPQLLLSLDFQWILI